MIAVYIHDGRIYPNNRIYGICTMAGYIYNSKIYPQWQSISTISGLIYHSRIYLQWQDISTIASQEDFYDIRISTIVGYILIVGYMRDGRIYLQ